MKRSGAVLIEVLAAVAILSIAGLSSLHYLTSVQDAQLREIARERQLKRADRLLTATALLTARELEQRIGVREAEEFLVWVDRPERFLFRIGISAAARPEAELLATLIYRYQEPIDARP